MPNSSSSSLRLMSDFNFTSKYARYLKEEKRRETFEEGVDRMLSMHMEKYKSNIEEDSSIGKGIEKAFKFVKEKRLLASQRALQFGGQGVESHNMRIYNCATSYCDRVRFFAETFYMLLCGCGVGFSIQKHHIARLPKLIDTGSLSSRPTIKHVIPDSIEGWSGSLDVLMGSFFATDHRSHASHSFDFSFIRERGAKLSTGGTAPGAEPLQRALIEVTKILTEAVDSGQSALTPIQCYDIVMHTADAVLSGGVRRSATIALFSPDDEEMLSAKTGNWYVENPQRGRSNNSVVLIKSEDSLDGFKKVMNSAKEFGEPGFLFVAHRDYIYNPCVEIGMCPQLIKDPAGNVLEEYSLETLNLREELIAKGYEFISGWQTCNLTEINAKKINSEKDFFEVVEAATIIGTLQAGYTKPGYLKGESKEIIERESLLGVSMTGMMDNPIFSFDYDLQSRMAKHAVEVNKEWARMLGLNSAARVTCVKPAGNSSVILETSSGIHPHHARRFIRRVQVNQDDPVYKYFKTVNPHMSEASVWSANKTDDVISFPIEISEDAIIKDDLDALGFLKLVKGTQQNWVESGLARPLSCEGLTHNVSNTCDISTNEWLEVGKFIYSNRADFAGLSFLGKSGDYIYRQAPMQKIVFEEELSRDLGQANVGAAKHIIRHITSRYGSLHKIMLPLKMVLSGYSSREAVRGTEIHSELLWDTYKKIRNLIHVKDTEEIIYLLASIHHEKIWNELVSNISSIDYLDLIEAVDNTKLEQTVACGGGSCDLSYTVVA